MRPALVMLCLAFLSTGAQAREADGRLGLLLLPNDARPALVLAGQSFVVVAREQAELALKSISGTFDVRTRWIRLPSGLHEGVGRVPPGAPPGMYTLEGVSDGTKDRNFRSVFVYESFPETYRVAHLSNLRIGSETGRDTRIFQSTKAINEADVAIVLVTGDLTNAGTPKQYAQALDLLGDCLAPTLVSLGHAEQASGLAGDFLGPSTFALRFGWDGYLGYYSATLDDLDMEGRAGEMYRMRRSIRSARWSVGFTNDYGPDVRLRDQLILFLDDPLDVVITARHALTHEVRFSIPWGDTRGFAMPTSDRGGVQIYDVGPGGVHLSAGPGHNID